MTGDLLKRFIDDVLFEENGPPAIRLQAIQDLITQYTNLAMSTASDEFELDISTRAERMHEFHKQLARRVSEEIPMCQPETALYLKSVLGLISKQ